MPCLFLPLGLLSVALALGVLLSAVRAWRQMRRWQGWSLIGDRLGCLTLLPPSDTLSALAVWPAAAGHDYAALDGGFRLRVVEEKRTIQAKEVQNG